MPTKPTSTKMIPTFETTTTTNNLSHQPTLTHHNHQYLQSSSPNNTNTTPYTTSNQQMSAATTATHNYAATLSPFNRDDTLTTHQQQQHDDKSTNVTEDTAHNKYMLAADQSSNMDNINKGFLTDSNNKYMLADQTIPNKGFLSATSSSSPYNNSGNHHIPTGFKDHHHSQQPHHHHHPFFTNFQTTTFHQRFNPVQFGMSPPGYFPNTNPYSGGSGGGVVGGMGLASFYDRMYEMEAKLPLDYARVWLDHQTLWRRFSLCGNEMIITKMGR